MSKRLPMRRAGILFLMCVRVRTFGKPLFTVVVPPHRSFLDVLVISGSETEIAEHFGRQCQQVAPINVPLQGVEGQQRAEGILRTNVVAVFRPPKG